MTPREITTIRETLGMTQASFAAIVGTTRAAVADWEAGRDEPPRAAAELMRAAVSNDLVRDEQSRFAQFLAEATELRSKRRYDEATDRIGPLEIGRLEHNISARALVALGAPELGIQRLDSLGFRPTSGVGPIMAPAAPLSLIAPLATLGAQFVEVAGLNDEMSVPVINADPDVYHLHGELDEVTLSAPGIGSRNVKAYTVAAFSRLGRQLMKMAATVTRVEQTVAAAQMRAMSRAINRQVIIGDGTNGTPYGLINALNMPNSDSAGSVTLDSVFDVVEDLETAEANPLHFGVILSPALAKTLRQSLTSVGGSTFMMARDPQSPTRESLLGIPALVLNGMPDDRLLIGDFSQLVVMSDPNVRQLALSNNDAAGATSLYAFEAYTYHVLHLAAFRTLTIT